MQINDSNYPPSKQLYADIKAAFVKQEMTFTAWCKSRDVKVPNAKSAIFGTWNGPKGKQVRYDAIEESGLHLLPKQAA